MLRKQCALDNGILCIALELGAIDGTIGVVGVEDEIVAVTIGGAPCAVTNATFTQVTCTTSAGGNGDVCGVGDCVVVRVRGVSAPLDPSVEYIYSEASARDHVVMITWPSLTSLGLATVLVT